MLHFAMAELLVFSCILMSFIERQVHRKLMQRKNLLSARTAFFRRVFDHALVHHKHYAEIFSDQNGRSG